MQTSRTGPFARCKLPLLIEIERSSIRKRPSVDATLSLLAIREPLCES
jgi:hypothetical protein